MPQMSTEPSSALVKVDGRPVVNLLAAFLQTNPNEAGRQEAERIFISISSMDEDEV